MEIDSLKEYHKNPRKITGKQYELLQASLKEFGDLSGVVVNVKTGEIIGGNQRTRILKTEGAKIEIIKKFDKPSSTGTVAYGYIILGDEKYNYREVSWDKKKEEIANIRANKVGGVFDFDILANQFDIEVLEEAGFEEYELANSSVGNLTKLETVNKGDENSEWIGMPVFDNTNNDYKIIFHFESEAEMADFVDTHSFKINKKLAKTWITTYPYKEYDKLVDLQYNLDEKGQ